MELSEAINDPSRPISIAPDQWMRQKDTMRRGSINTDETMVSEMDPISKIDNAIDGMVSNIKLLLEGLSDLDKTTLSTDEKRVFDAVRDIVETAIAPYIAEAAEELDSLED